MKIRYAFVLVAMTLIGTESLVQKHGNSSMIEAAGSTVVNRSNQNQKNPLPKEATATAELRERSQNWFSVDADTNPSMGDVPENSDFKAVKREPDGSGYLSGNSDPFVDASAARHRATTAGLPIQRPNTALIEHSANDI